MFRRLESALRALFRQPRAPAKPELPAFPPKTEFFDVEGVPVALMPTSDGGRSCKAFDRPSGEPPSFPVSKKLSPMGLVAKDGRAVVLDSGFAATKVGDSWAPGLRVASVDELNDEFTMLPDEAGAALAKEARTALAGPVGFVSKDGRAAVIDVGGWAASKLGGSWVPGLKFSADELNDDFTGPPDKAAAALVKEARTALSS